MLEIMAAQLRAELVAPQEQALERLSSRAVLVALGVLTLVAAEEVVAQDQPGPGKMAVQAQQVMLAAEAEAEAPTVVRLRRARTVPA